MLRAILCRPPTIAGDSWREEFVSSQQNITFKHRYFEACGITARLHESECPYSLFALSACHRDTPASYEHHPTSSWFAVRMNGKNMFTWNAGKFENMQTNIFW